MRIPTGEFFNFFAATGQLSSHSSLRGADSGFSLPRRAVAGCARSFTVGPDTSLCDSIGASNNAPSFQIICQNDQINGECTNLSINEEICLGRQEEDCQEVYVVEWPETTASSIADKFNIPLDLFNDNNYCYDSDSGKVCPPLKEGNVVCIATSRVNRPKCEKIFI